MTEDAPQQEEDGLTYQEAVVELEQLLQKIEAQNIDVDALSDAVERAAFLLKFCRGRIARAETRINEVLADVAEVANNKST